MQKDIVATLISQHRELQSVISQIKVLIDEKKEGFSKTVLEKLKTFELKLKEHLELENNVFYVELLSKLKAKGVDISGIDKFILEMKDIEREVYYFLSKYYEKKSINEDLAEFKLDFNRIVEYLNLRIESEESGVYMYWDIYDKK